MAAVGPLMLRALLRGELPPVGEAVHCISAPPPVFTGYHPLWLDSGTSALALALRLARERAPQVRTPEVVLPGYACPDLVAAALHAGVRPVLVDLAKDDCGYDLDALENAIGERCVAVVAVNFLGVAERLPALQALLAARPQIALIEDNAQWFPEPPQVLRGDYVCLSFGRGKPVSLLGGGALLVREGVAAPEVTGKASGSGSAYRLKTTVYNLLLQRHLYAAATRNPWVSVGDTVFEPLRAIAPLGGRVRFLAANVDRHLARSRQLEQTLATIAARSPHIAVDLAAATGRGGRLLRYPVLCPTAELRAELLGTARAQGLGVTAMYQHPLPQIAGVAPRIERMTPLPNAERFAERLLTLPLHAGVMKDDVGRLARWLGAE